MAKNIKDLVVRIAVDDADIEKFQKAGAKAFDFGNAVTTAGIVAAGALVGMGVGLYALGSTFDDVTDTIRIGTGATGEALDDLVQSAKNVGTQIPVEWAKVGPAVADVNTRLGLTGETLETVSMQFLEAGRALGEDIDIQAATGALSAFKVEGDNVSGALDILFQVSQATGIGFNDLSSKVSAAAPLVQQLGFSFDETAGLVGTLDKAGLDVSGTLGKLAPALVRLAKDGEQPADVFPRVIAELEGFIEAGDTASALNLAESVFGSRGASQFIGALQAGAINLDDLAASATLSGDSILAAAADTNDFAEKWQIVQNKATAALEPLGSAVFTALADALDAVSPGLEAVASWASENPETLQLIAGIIGVVAGGVVALAAGMKIFAVAQAIQTAAQWASNAAWLASPVTWIVIAIIAAIALLVAAGLWLYENWDEVIAWFGEAWANVCAWFQEVGDGIAAWWNDLWTGIAQWVLDTFGPMISWVQEQFSLMQTGLKIVGDGISAWWNDLWSGIGDFFGDIWNALQDIVRGSWNAIVGWIEDGVNNAIGLINGIIRGINDIGGDIGIRLNLIPSVSIPRLATGGITTGPTLAMVGDNPGGREAILPLDSPAARQMLGGGDGPVKLDDESLEKLARLVARAVRSSGRDGGAVFT